MSSDPSNDHPRSSAESQAAVDDSIETELPFLVTHWLSNYANKKGRKEDGDEDAIRRVRKAASDLASAFSSLGAFGSANVVGPYIGVLPRHCVA